MLLRILYKVVACLIIRLRSRVGHPRAVIRSAGFVCNNFLQIWQQSVVLFQGF